MHRWILLSVCTLLSCAATKPSSNEVINKVDPLHIVFVTGDEEYRSEESMPMLAAILERELGAKVSICYAATDGIVDPNRSDHIVGLEALETADLMVMFLRFRQLPDEQLKYITDYVATGKPMVGFRTSTHAFNYDAGHKNQHMNHEWATRVFGQQWITHHGHFDDGDHPLTEVNLIDDNTAHPILNGVTPFKAFSWLYHVQGGGWHVFGQPNHLLTGTSLRSKHEAAGRTDQYPMTNPVAWTKDYHGARVFFTTLGHPYDFKIASMRKLSLNGIYWALGLESEIPDLGVSASVEGTYEPNNSGFGEKFKKGLKATK